jgi:glycosyltransferase involved in cell wall biosynthesis
MKISVIIPTHNRTATLGRAIQSVLDQTFPALEIIVVDDASTDITPHILEKYSGKIRIITNETNQGVSYARNVGIQEARGDWLAFLDSDDQWAPTKLERQKQFHDSHPSILISQCDEIWIRNNVRVNPMSKHQKRGGWIFEACIPLCIVSPSAVIIHKSVFEHIGLFDTNLLACEDYDLWLRIAPHYEIGLLEEKLMTRFGGHDDQLSRKYWGMDRFRIMAMEKHVGSNMSPVWKKTLLDELYHKCGVVAAGAKKRNKHEMADLYLEKQKEIHKILLRI